MWAMFALVFLALGLFSAQIFLAVTPEGLRGGGAGAPDDACHLFAARGELIFD